MSMKELWVQAFKAGTHKDVAGRTDTFTESDLDGMVTAFADTYPALQPPIFLGGHESKNDLGIAPGWVTELKREGEKLMAKVKLAPNVHEAVQKELYKTVSPRIDWNKEVEGRRHPKVLTHLALLGKNIPAVKGMDDLQTFFSEPLLTAGCTDSSRMYQETLDLVKEDDMDLAQQVADLTTKVATLTANQATKDAAHAVALTAKDAELEAANKVSAAFTEQESKRKEDSALEEVRSFCEERVESGAMPPAAREVLLEAIGESRAYSEDAGLEFDWAFVRKYTEALGTAKPAEGESGTGGGTGDGGNAKDATAQLMEKTETLAIERGMSFAEALPLVRDANPELTRQYVAEVGGPGGE
jgi:hypothetical protein